jgi:hypothetical protein
MPEGGAMKKRQNKLFKIVFWVFISVFIFTGCYSANDKNGLIRRDYTNEITGSESYVYYRDSRKILQCTKRETVRVQIVYHNDKPVLRMVSFLNEKSELEGVSFTVLPSHDVVIQFGPYDKNFTKGQRIAIDEISIQKKGEQKDTDIFKVETGILIPVSDKELAERNYPFSEEATKKVLIKLYPNGDVPN